MNKNNIQINLLFIADSPRDDNVGYLLPRIAFLNIGRREKDVHILRVFIRVYAHTHTHTL